MTADPSLRPTSPSWRDESPAPHAPLAPADLAAFSAELDALHARLVAALGPDDLSHLRRMERWGRACTLAGYALAWFPNPLAAFLIALGNTARWGCVVHHVLHRGYDAVPGVPARFRSEVFARGWRRWIDWADWLHPPAWVHEHNHLHHYHTGQREDPDLVERNARLMRLRAIPLPLRWLLVALFVASWKWLYYAPNTLWTLRHARRQRALGGAAAARQAGLVAPADAWCVVVPGERLLLPVTRGGVELWLRCLLPYALFRFGLLPALFLPLGTAAWACVLVTSLAAELLANVHSFLIIAPNHTGDDVHRFDGGVRGRAEFQLQQVAGSVNYTGGSDLPDFLQGYLNYQIEHHLWPDLPLLKYRQAAPEVKRICARHGVPYIEEPLPRRIGKLFAVMLGRRSMRRTDMTLERARRAIPTAPTVAAPVPTAVAATAAAD